MSKVSESLDKLSLNDTYSLIMFVLYKIQDIPELAPLSQLVYLLDEKSVIKLLKYFGGQTITFPTMEELETLVYTLTLYQKVELNEDIFDEAILTIPSNKRRDVKKMYNKVASIMGDYSFV